MFWWKKKHVFQRGGNYVLLVSKNTHVFARGVAILNCSGGQRNVFFREGRKFVLFVGKTTKYLPKGVANLFS